MSLHLRTDAAFDAKVAYWRTLPTDDGATFDKEYYFDAEDIEPMVTYGTNPGMGIKISETIPVDSTILRLRNLWTVHEF